MKADQSLFSGLMTDIRDNVAVGHAVTVHEKTIHYKGWKGSEYIIIDPQTGSRAYLIDGGVNKRQKGEISAWRDGNYHYYVSKWD